MCEHNLQIGDNYGVTCQICGEILEGYGYFAQSDYCIHVWSDSGEGYECIYCQEWIDKHTWQLYFG